MSAQTKTLSTGPAAAAMLSAGIGAFTMGLMTTASEASADLANALKFYGPSGPLSGKTTVAIIVWLVSWLILGSIWKNKDSNLRSIFTWTLVLVGLGILLTFPIFFDLFAPA
jgi:hypothetical protein